MILPAKNQYANGNPVYRVENNTLTFYFKHGGIKATGGFVNDMMQGKWIFYRENGQLWSVGHFLNDQKHGHWLRYDKNDAIEQDEMFEHGKKVKKTSPK